MKEKLCDTCRYRNNVEQLKPCIIYRDDCEYYEKERDDMTREEIVKLAVDNDLVEEVYDTLHFITMAKLGNLRNRVDNAESDLRLIKKFADANKLDVIKDILSEEIVESEIQCNHTDAEIAKSFIEDVEAVKDLLPRAESEEI